MQELFDFEKENCTATNKMNSAFISDEDIALSRCADADGYDLDAPARVYCAGIKGFEQNLWAVSTRDAMRICSHPKSRGRSGNWAYFWTQHDVEGAGEKGRAKKWKDDGRLKDFEGLEDVKILWTY